MKNFLYTLLSLSLISSSAFATAVNSSGEVKEDLPQTSVGPISGDVYQEGMSPEKFNTSPNPAPTTEAEVIDNSVLRNGQEDVIQAEEAEETQEAAPSTKPDADKIGN